MVFTTLLGLTGRFIAGKWINLPAGYSLEEVDAVKIFGPSFSLLPVKALVHAYLLKILKSKPLGESAKLIRLTDAFLFSL